MSDSEETNNSQIQEQPQVEVPTESVELPPQESPADTSNWENRPLTTPSERLVIENFDPSRESGQVPEE